MACSVQPRQTLTLAETTSPKHLEVPLGVVVSLSIVMLRMCDFFCNQTNKRFFLLLTCHVTLTCAPVLPASGSMAY